MLEQINSHSVNVQIYMTVYIRYIISLDHI